MIEIYKLKKWENIIRLDTMQFGFDIIFPEKIMIYHVHAIEFGLDGARHPIFSIKGHIKFSEIEKIKEITDEEHYNVVIQHIFEHI